MAVNNSVEMILKHVESLGWSVTKRRKHYQAFAPDQDGGIVTISATPSDYRAIQKIRSNFRRLGVNIP